MFTTAANGQTCHLPFEKGELSAPDSLPPVLVIGSAALQVRTRWHVGGESKVVVPVGRLSSKEETVMSKQAVFKKMCLLG